MNLFEKTEQLLNQQVPFVTARIYDNGGISELNLGTSLLVTDENFWGKVLPVKLETHLVESARQVLAKQKSVSQKIQWENTTLKIFWEVFTPKHTLLIAGAGHIAVPLCRMAHMQGFDVIILDDREDYANIQRFPQADRILVGPFAQTLQNLELNSWTYVVLVTRGHTHDKDCLLEIMPKQVAYIGMIGSLRRLAGVFRLLEEEGHPPETLAQIHAPIGLPIGGDTPEAIALSIMAEIVSVRYRGKEWSLALKKEFKKLKRARLMQDLELHQTLQHYHFQGIDTVLVTIVEKNGSTPRGVGAKMLVLPNAQCFGTIGGGCVESSVKSAALEIIIYNKGPQVKTINLNDPLGVEDGDICGGTITVLMEHIPGKKES